MAFRVGMKVVCVETPPTDKFFDEIYPTKGEVYTIRGIVPFHDGPGVRLREIVNPPHYYPEMARREECCFCASRFRPVVETDISIFQRMLSPTPKKERVTG